MRFRTGLELIEFLIEGDAPSDEPLELWPELVAAALFVELR